MVGLDGKRHLIRGLEGQSLVNVLHANHEVFGEEGELGSADRALCLQGHILLYKRGIRHNLEHVYSWLIFKHARLSLLHGFGGRVSQHCSLRRSYPKPELFCSCWALTRRKRRGRSARHGA